MIVPLVPARLVDVVPQNSPQEAIYREPPGQARPVRRSFRPQANLQMLLLGKPGPRGLLKPLHKYSRL